MIDFAEMADFLDDFNLNAKEKCLPMVPLLYIGQFIWKSVEELLAYAAEQKYANGFPAEGIVVRPTTEFYSNTLQGRASFKVINNKYKE